MRMFKGGGLFLAAIILVIVGVILGLSRERVRQLESRALLKLRRLIQNRYKLATAA